jgi:hypothetical protein
MNKKHWLCYESLLPACKFHHPRIELFCAGHDISVQVLPSDKKLHFKCIYLEGDVVWELNIQEVGAGVEPRLPLEVEPVLVKADLCILQVYNGNSI